MADSTGLPEFRRPNIVERLFNRTFGLLVAVGIGLPHNYLVEVRGRGSGKLYSTPVDVLDLSGKRYLVAPRGRTQLVRNAEAAGEVALYKAFRRRQYRVRAIADAEKPPFLKAYLDRFAPTVQRYFPIRAGSKSADFISVAASYPVFELQEMASQGTPGAR
jgi:hypothetical protein